MGHRLSKDGFSPDPDKVIAISNMPRPDCKKAVEHFFRLFTVLFSFPTTIGRSSSSTETVNRAINHIHMANSTRRSIPGFENYDHQSSNPKIL